MLPFSRRQLVDELKPLRKLSQSDHASTKILQEFYERHDQELRDHHYSGGSGLENAVSRTELINAILITLFNRAQNDEGKSNQLTLIATGGFGRGLLNPKSDVDLLFLTRKASEKIRKTTEQSIHQTLYPLWDLGLDVGYAVRSHSEMMKHGKIDPHAKTSLLESRHIAGPQAPFAQLKERFTQSLVKQRREEFVSERLEAMAQRHSKYGSTVFLQEPQIKEGPGGLRDFHHLLWFTFASQGTLDASALVEAGTLTKRSYRALKEAYEFLHRVRNGLHYDQRRSTDILTLRLQGVIAEQFDYPHADLLRKIEAFMRDYYRSTRLIFERTQTVAEVFKLECEAQRSNSLVALVLPTQKAEHFEGFKIHNGFIDAPAQTFRKDPSKLLQVFQISQKRGLRLAPDLRKRIKARWDLIDDHFRTNSEHQEIFRSILERKGEVAGTLRRMHRVGVLGRFLPEFGALDCLVQHEFFHRYTADEHTLRCIEELDRLSEDGPDIFRKLFREMEDPFAIYLSLILHDTGRAENVREHTDGSAMLTMEVCSRLNIHGNRLRLVMFLVDHHLTFWRYATSRNLEDEQVIREFASLIKSQNRLDALFLFTYADSKGTHEDGWNMWKESLMLQLYQLTSDYFHRGQAEFEAERQSEKLKLREKVRSLLQEDETKYLDDHFELMPERYFHFRTADAVARHVRALGEFRKLEKSSDGTNFTCAAQWREHPRRGYCTLMIVAHDKDFSLQRVCCVLASEQLNILSADIFTRPDGIVLDVIRVATRDLNHLANPRVMDRVIEKIRRIHSIHEFDPSDYLCRKNNYLHSKATPDIPFPVRAIVRNDLSAHHTALEVQAIDRIGLLHDLFSNLSNLGIRISNARIATEKGAAMDTLYITGPDGDRVTDAALIQKIESSLAPVISQMEE